jgi:hypothetical protein
MPMSSSKKPDSPGTLLSPLLGWLTYIAAPYSALISAPNGVDAQKVAGGTVFSLCEEPFTIDNAKHMATAAAMERALQVIRR